MTNSTPPVGVQLNAARRMYRAVAHRAIQVRTVVGKLQAVRIWLPRDKALNDLAHAIYFNAQYDVSEQFPSAEAYLEELTPDVDREWPERGVSADVTCYVLRPFLTTPPEYLTPLGLGYLACSSKVKYPWNGLDLPTASPVLDTTVVLHDITDEEGLELVQGYTRKALTLINAMRQLKTTLAYLKICIPPKIVGPNPTAPLYPHDVELTALLAELDGLCDLPFGAPPAGHFSSDSDKVNVLTSLPGHPWEIERLLAALVSASAGYSASA